MANNAYEMFLLNRDSPAKLDNRANCYDKISLFENTLQKNIFEPNSSQKINLLHALHRVLLRAYRNDTIHP